MNIGHTPAAALGDLLLTSCIIHYSLAKAFGFVLNNVFLFKNEQSGYVKFPAWQGFGSD